MLGEASGKPICGGCLGYDLIFLMRGWTGLHAEVLVTILRLSTHLLRPQAHLLDLGQCGVRGQVGIHRKVLADGGHFYGMGHGRGPRYDYVSRCLIHDVLAIALLG